MRTLALLLVLLQGDLALGPGLPVARQLHGAAHRLFGTPVEGGNKVTRRVGMGLTGDLAQTPASPVAHREYDKLCAGGSRADPSIGDGSTDIHPRVRTNPLCTQGSALLPWPRQPVRFAPSGSLLACNNPFPCRLFDPFD